MIPAIALSELEILEPTLVSNEVYLENDNLSSYYHQHTDKYYFVNYNKNDISRLFYYLSGSNSMKIFKEFDGKTYGRIQFFKGDSYNVFFSIANKLTLENEIWITDGTESGTKQIIGFTMPYTTTKSTGIYNFYSQTNEHMLFIGGLDGNEILMQTDGTSKGTRLFPYLDSDQYQIVIGLKTVRGKFIFQTVRKDTSGIHDLWLSNMMEGVKIYSGVKNESFNLYCSFKRYCFLFPNQKGEYRYDRPLIRTDGTMKGTIDLLEGQSKYSYYKILLQTEERLIIQGWGEDLYSIISTDGTIDGTKIIDESENLNDLIVYDKAVNNDFIYYNRIENKIYITDGNDDQTELETPDNFSKLVYATAFSNDFYLVIETKNELNGDEQIEVWSFQNSVRELNYIFSQKTTNIPPIVFGWFYGKALIFSNLQDIWLCDEDIQFNKKLISYDEKIYNFYIPFLLSNNNYALFGMYDLDKGENTLYSIDKFEAFRKIEIKNTSMLEPYFDFINPNFIQVDNKYLFDADYIGDGRKIYSINLDEVITSVSESQQIKPLTYPNPARNHLTVKGIENQNVSIFNLEGELISEKILNGNSINVSEFTPGVYIIIGSDGNFITKFVKE